MPIYTLYTQCVYAPTLPSNVHTYNDGRANSHHQPHLPTLFFSSMHTVCILVFRMSQAWLKPNDPTVRVSLDGCMFINSCCTILSLALLYSYTHIFSSRTLHTAPCMWIWCWYHTTVLNMCFILWDDVMRISVYTVSCVWRWVHFAFHIYSL